MSALRNILQYVYCACGVAFRRMTPMTPAIGLCAGSAPSSSRVPLSLAPGITEAIGWAITTRRGLTCTSDLCLPQLRAVLRSFPMGEQVSVHAGTVGDEHVRHHTRGCGHLWLRRHDDTGVVPTMAAAGCLLPVQPQPQRDQQPTPGTWPRMVPPITMSNAPCLQDPAAFGAEFAANVRDVLLIRYRLIPFLYSLFHRSYALGGTVARPLMFEFTSDVNTYAIDKQMLWGESFLITPVLEVQ